MSIDVKNLIARAAALRKNAHYQKALEIYLYMADGDPSLDAGWTAVQIAECYDLLQRPTEARYWAARAFEQNPAVSDRREILQRLGRILPEHLVDDTGFQVSWVSRSTLEDRAESDRILRTIKGSEAIFDWFGEYRPSFHDAEVLRLDLDRREPSSLSLRVVYPRPATVTFELGDWIDVNLDCFSGQNVIFELGIRSASNRAVEDWERGVGLRPGEHELELLPTFGANGLIRATIKSISLRPDKRSRSERP